MVVRDAQCEPQRIVRTEIGLRVDTSASGVMLVDDQASFRRVAAFFTSATSGPRLCAACGQRMARVGDEARNRPRHRGIVELEGGSMTNHTATTNPTATADGGVTGWIASELQHDVIRPIEDFQDPSQEWRRLFSELLGTFLLVLVAAGGGMMGAGLPEHDQPYRSGHRAGADGDGDHHVHGQGVGRAPEPGRQHRVRAAPGLPWRRVPGYIIVQLIGATLAALLLHGVINVSAGYGSNYVAAGYSGARRSDGAVLTFGLVSVILGTASGAQNIGIIAALGVGGVHRPRRAVGKPHLGRVDEPRADVRS